MLTFLGTGSLWASPGTPINPDRVADYRVEKDSAAAHILQLYNDPKFPSTDRDTEDRQELKNLESLLRPMLKQPTFTKDQPKRSAIHLETLLPAPGYACLDGLDYFFAPPSNFPQRLFFSDLALIRDAKTPESSHMLTDIRQRFMDRIQCDDATHTHYATVHGIRKQEFDEVYAELALAGQDIGPYPPNELAVLARKGTQIYVFVLPAGDQIFAVDACNKLFREATSPDDKNEEASFKQLVGCYSDHFEHAQNDPALKTLRAQADNVLSQIKP
jgi:hypothetical protein